MPIQAIERAAAILRELDGGRSLRLNELCERLGLAKGTTHGSTATHTQNSASPTPRATTERSSPSSTPRHESDVK